MCACLGFRASYLGFNSFLNLNLNLNLNLRSQAKLITIIDLSGIFSVV